MADIYAFLGRGTLDFEMITICFPFKNGTNVDILIIYIHFWKRFMNIWPSIATYLQY